MKNIGKFFLDTQLYRSGCSPCPYVAGRTEQQIFTVLAQAELDFWAGRLNRMGFRRSMNSVYMPMCSGCQACRSVRVQASLHTPSAGMRRVLRKNTDIEFRLQPPIAEPKMFLLFRRYLQHRHTSSDMNEINEHQFTQLIQSAPSDTYQLCAYHDDRLLGVMIVDRFNDGTSAVYSFFDPDERQRSLGTLMVLELLRRTREQGLPYVYLGYYVAEARNMAYKARFSPLEVFDWESMSWSGL